MSIISMVLVVFVAFLAGLEGILDQFQFHQPLVACTLIGLVTGNLAAGVMLGGSLQLIALGWANIGAAVAPDAALASVAAAIIMVLGGDFSSKAGVQLRRAVKPGASGWRAGRESRQLLLQSGRAGQVGRSGAQAG